MPSSSFRKICPKCRKSDLTDLPKCRFCNTPYLAVLQGNRLPNSNDKTLFVIMGCVILLIVGFGASRSLNQQQEKKLAPLVSAIKAANRPRLVEFYATWCGPCQSYGPVVEEAEAKYRENIDFVRLDVDQPEGSALGENLGVSAIPRTFIFDRQGKQVFDREGVVSAEELDRTLSVLAR